MMLSVAKGQSANFEVIMHAIRNTPSLIIDCANYANPHLFYPFSNPDSFNEVYVVAVDAIYRFRDTMKVAGRYAKDLGVRCIVVTTFHRLFSYDDEEETNNVIEHTWELIKGLSKRYDVRVADKDGAYCVERKSRCRCPDR